MKVPGASHIDENKKLNIVFLFAVEFFGERFNSTTIQITAKPEMNDNIEKKFHKLSSGRVIRSSIQSLSNSQLFELKKSNPTDDIIVLEFSSCSGDLSLKISNTPDFEKVEHYDVESISGRQIYKLKHPQELTYLMVEAINGTSSNNCRYLNGQYTCKGNITESEFMLNYLSTNTELYGDRKSIEKNG